MSSYSSLGPSYELDFKPSISAPGGFILTTFPNDTFGIASGTSISGEYHKLSSTHARIQLISRTFCKPRLSRVRLL